MIPRPFDGTRTADLGCYDVSRDATEQLLFVHRWSPEGYVVVLRAAAGDIVRAEPFEAIEIAVSDLFGDA